MKKTISILLLAAIAIVVITCKKTPEIPSGNKIEIGETTIDSIGYYGLKLITLISGIQGNNIEDLGYCWSIDKIPTLDDNVIVANYNDSSINYTLTGLSASQQYKIRPYIVTSHHTIYGNEITTTTLSTSTPIVSTNDISDITTISAICGGANDDGGLSFVSRGVCWNTSNNPTLQSNIGVTSDGSGSGNFTSYISGLTENTTYFVAAYATNEKGTSYGEVKQFSTVPITTPTVTTAEISEITTTYATSGGDVTSNGNGTVTARGVCWNTTGSPNLENNIGITTNGTGTESYTSQLTGLTENTTYYVAAYATNSKGTAYGNEITFTTLSPPWQCGDLLSYEGQNYTTVLIGTQCWMAENLNVGVRIIGGQEQTNNSQIEKYCYNDTETNCNVYGGLYQWDEMMQYGVTEDTQGICPTGWHLPSDNEWTVLVNFLGGGSVAGGKMKEIGTSHWSSPNTGATNSSGFTALPGGYRSTDGNFDRLGYVGYWWSATEYSSASPWSRDLHYDYDGVDRPSFYDKGRGFSVRCVRD